MMDDYAIYEQKPPLVIHHYIREDKRSDVLVRLSVIEERLRAIERSIKERGI